MTRTRWLVDGVEGTVCTLEIPNGRAVRAGELLRLSPRVGEKGAVWRVVAVESEPGYDGRLYVQPATDVTLPGDR